jgi:CRISPR-associated protein Csm1
MALRELAARTAQRRMSSARSIEIEADTQERGALTGLAARLRLRNTAETEIEARMVAQQEAFHAQLSSQLRDLLPSLPVSVGKMLMTLVPIDLPTGRSDLTQLVGLEVYDAWVGAWTEVLGRPLFSWVCTAPELSGRIEQRYATQALLRSVRLPNATGAKSSVVSLSEPFNFEQCWVDMVRAMRMLPKVEAVGWRVWLDAIDSLLERSLTRLPVFAEEQAPLDTLVDAARLSAAVGACRVAAPSSASPNEDLEGLRLVSIEFTPIQDFVFLIQPNSPWRVDAALGGRSSFVRLTVDLAALSILDRLGLPSCCHLNSAASKALLLVPDTKQVRLELRNLARSFDNWALRQLAGTGGMCVSHTMVRRQLLSIRPAQTLSESILPLERLAQQSALAKLQRFGLASNLPPLLKPLWDDLRRCRAFCSLDGVTPGAVRNSEGLDIVCAERLDAAPPLSVSARMQLSLGRDLGVADVLVVHRHKTKSGGELERRRDWHFGDLTLSLVEGAAKLDPHQTLAAWDIAYGTRPLVERHFKGLAIRSIALPRGRWQGGAIAMLKGDVDRLGQIFRSGLDRATLARSIRLSREVDDFFSIHVPVLMQQAFPEVQTVLCGGDDFVFVGPAQLMPTVATRLFEEFQQHCANPSLTFSAGLCVAEPGESLSDLSEAAESALELAKKDRSSICAHGVSVSWNDWLDLERLQARITTDLKGDEASKVDFLERACAVIDAREQTRHFTGHRTRERLRSVISRFVGKSDFDRRNQVVDEDKAAKQQRFWRLVDRLEAEGFLRHGAATRIPLQNLILVYKSIQPRTRGRREAAV